MNITQRVPIKQGFLQKTKKVYIKWKHKQNNYIQKDKQKIFNRIRLRKRIKVMKQKLGKKRKLRNKNQDNIKQKIKKLNKY